MGFMDKAKKMAEQAQAKLDEAQKQFNSSQDTAGQSGGPAVEYDKHATGGFRNSAPHTTDQSAMLQVEPVAGGFLPWNAIDLHAESDTLVAGSDAQSILIVQHASKVQQHFA